LQFEAEVWAKLRNKVDHREFIAGGDIDIEMATRMIEPSPVRN
jgi:hypothetical protein